MGANEDMSFDARALFASDVLGDYLAKKPRFKRHRPLQSPGLSVGSHLPSHSLAC